MGLKGLRVQGLGFRAFRVSGLGMKAFGVSEGFIGFVGALQVNFKAFRAFGALWG